MLWCFIISTSVFTSSLWQIPVLQLETSTHLTSLTVSILDLWRRRPESDENKCQCATTTQIGDGLNGIQAETDVTAPKDEFLSITQSVCALYKLPEGSVPLDRRHFIAAVIFLVSLKPQKEDFSRQVCLIPDERHRRLICVAVSCSQICGVMGWRGELIQHILQIRLMCVRVSALHPITIHFSCLSFVL